MKKIQVDTLYRFRSLNEEDIDHTKDIFKNKRLFMPSPALFNDPFECRAYYSNEASQKVKEQATLSLNKRHNSNLSVNQTIKALDNLTFDRAIKQDREEVGVLSFTEVKDNILMWSHYADSHRGLCIEFHNGENERCSKFFMDLDPIEYTEFYPTIHKYDYCINRDLEKLVDTTFFKKSLIWEYEKEWRVALPYKYTQDKYIPLPDKIIRAVYLGCEIIDDTKAEMIKAISDFDKEVIVYQVERDNKSFALNYFPIN